MANRDPGRHGPERMNEHASLVLGIVASMIVAFLAFFFSIFMVATVPDVEVETVTVAAIVWVEADEIPALQEKYGRDVPVCTDLPPVEDIEKPSVPIACWLEAVR